MSWREDILTALSDFERVSELAGDRIRLQPEDVEFLPAPHKPPGKLPVGRAAVYGFWHDGDWLKIGQVGPKSGPRYTSQHYNGSAPSTRLGALKRDQEWIDREWIEQNTSRVNIFVPPDKDLLRSLLEAFLHVRLRPRYEK